MTQEVVFMMLRYALLALGAFLAGKGYGSAADWEPIIGAFIALSSGVWGIYVRWRTVSVPAHTALGKVVSPATGQITQRGKK